MKIGILTFHRSQNYGALLQALGLQQFLENQGHNVSFIDYWPAYHSEMYKHFSWKEFTSLSNKAKVKYLVTFFGTFVRLSIRHRNTRRFIDKYFHITHDDYYDLVIYGSDQIWRKHHRPGCDGYNPIYFGDGLINTPHKVAYAASMGIIEVNNDKDHHFLSNSFNNFDAISVREVDLHDYIVKEFGLSFPLVLDPVFLLTQDQWATKTNPKYLPHRKYILYYRLQNIADSDVIVNEVSRQTGLSIIELRGYVPLGHYGKRYRFTADAEEMITLINGAEIVVTSAFHGVAMSLCFQKQFLYASQKQQANRVFSLLSQVDLTNRIVVDNIIPKEPIDYVSVNKKLMALQSESRLWLLSQLK